MNLKSAKTKWILINKRILLLLFIIGFPIISKADQYLTDTPQTMDYEQGEADVYSDLTKVKKDYILRAPALEANIGVMTDFQVRINIPAALSITPHKKTTYGYGDLDIGFKYRFIHETDVIPQVAFYPKITLPSGFPEQRLGKKKSFERLPIWIQKSWEKWLLSGGGGYAIDHNPQAFNYFFGGILLRHIFNPTLTVGLELFAQGPRSLNDRSTLFLNLGATYNFTPRVFMLLGTAHSIAGLNTLKGFVGLGINWGPESSLMSSERSIE